MSGGFLISEIKRFKANDHFLGEGVRYYKAKLLIFTYNELGDTKKTTAFVLVQAHSTEDANEKINAEMGKKMIDYEIHTVAETAILDVFMYEEGREG